MNLIQTCPACGSSALFGFFSVRGARSRRKSKVRICRSCHGLFHRSGYAETEEQLQKDLEWHIQMTGHLRYERIVAECLDLHPDARSFLDIGSGIGNTLQIAKERGMEICGVEPNPYAVEYAQQERNLAIRNEYFESRLLDRKFDIVVIDNVLEHLEDPFRFVQDVVNVMNVTGICYIAVPGNSHWFLRVLYSFLFRKRNRSIFRDADVHINNFSKKSLVALVGRNHFLEIVKMGNGTVIFRKIGDV